MRPEERTRVSRLVIRSLARIERRREWLRPFGPLYHASREERCRARQLAFESEELFIRLSGLLMPPKSEEKRRCDGIAA